MGEYVLFYAIFDVRLLYLYLYIFVCICTYMYEVLVRCQGMLTLHRKHPRSWTYAISTSIAQLMANTVACHFLSNCMCIPHPLFGVHDSMYLYQEIGISSLSMSRFHKFSVKRSYNINAKYITLTQTQKHTRVEHVEIG